MNLKNVIAAIALVATTTLVLVYTGDRYPQTFFSADLVDVTGDGVPELVVLDRGTLDQTDERAFGVYSLATGEALVLSPEGEPAVALPSSPYQRSTALVGELFIVAEGDARVTAFNVKTGAMAWRTKLDSAPLRDTDGMFRLMVRDAVLLAAGSVHGREKLGRDRPDVVVTRLNPTDGKVMWAKPFFQAYGHPHPPDSPDSLALAASHLIVRRSLDECAFQDLASGDVTMDIACRGLLWDREGGEVYSMHHTERAKPWLELTRFVVGDGEPHFAPVTADGPLVKVSSQMFRVADGGAMLIAEQPDNAWVAVDTRTGLKTWTLELPPFQRAAGLPMGGLATTGVAADQEAGRYEPVELIDDKTRQRSLVVVDTKMGSIASRTAPATFDDRYVDAFVKSGHRWFLSARVKDRYVVMVFDGHTGRFTAALTATPETSQSRLALHQPIGLHQVAGDFLYLDAYRWGTVLELTATGFRPTRITSDGLGVESYPAALKAFELVQGSDTVDAR